MTRDDDRQKKLDLALFLAVTKGDKAEVRRALREGANPDTVVEGRRSAFVEAVNLRRFALARLLLQHGAHVNYQEQADVSMPPWVSGIMSDVQTQSLERTRFYLANGADFSLRFAYGAEQRPHTFAEVARHLPLVLNARQAATLAAACDLIAAHQRDIMRQRHDRLTQGRKSGGGGFKL